MNEADIVYSVNRKVCGTDLEPTEPIEYDDSANTVRSLRYGERELLDERQCD